MRVLGIETSCDETAAAVVEDGRRALSDVVSSQVEIHRRWGGVVPELASRNHVVQVMPVVDEALARADLVVNRPAFNVVLTRENLKSLETTLQFIEQQLRLDRAVVLARLKKYENTPFFQPITIKEDVSWVDLSTIEAHAREHPELSISQEPRRLYPLRSVASHILG